MKDFPSQFGLYVVFDPSNYEGSILTVRNNSDVFFEISLFASNDTRSVLLVTLPGLGTNLVEIPEDVDLQNASSYRSLGVRLFNYQLLVIVDCEVVNFLNLERSPDPLPVGTSSVEFLEEGARVSAGILGGVGCCGCGYECGMGMDIGVGERSYDRDSYRGRQGKWGLALILYFNLAFLRNNCTYTNSNSPAPLGFHLKLFLPKISYGREDWEDLCQRFCRLS